MAYRGNRLGLHEEVVLLALEDRRGTFQWGASGAVIGGAILGELLLEKRIRFDGKSGRSSGAEPKNPFVELVDDEPPGCPVLDEALERIALAARRGRVGDWVSRFANRRNVHRHIAEQLCRRGILREDEESVLLFFKRKIYPEVNPVPERKLLDRLEKAVFGEETVDDRTAMLVALAHDSRLLETPFGKSRLKPRRKRLESMGESSSDIGVLRAEIRRLQDEQAAATVTFLS